MVLRAGACVRPLADLIERGKIYTQCIHYKGVAGMESNPKDVLGHDEFSVVVVIVKPHSIMGREVDVLILHSFP